MAAHEDIWPKSISVDKRIVRILSESTYENFPRALKELITNSYDADAKNVSVTVDIKNETLVVADDGKGMNEHDFSFYIRIAGKKREKEDNTTPLGRQIIGQFGVGFLSIFPFFKSYHIESKKSGTRTTLHADIPLFKYFSDDNKALDIDDILINGGKREVEGKVNHSFTKITLSGFNELTKSFFFSNTDHKKSEKASIKSYDGLSVLKWTLSEDLPISFKNNKFNDLFDYKSTPEFTVTVNGEILYRNSYGDQILEKHSGIYKQIGKIRCQYFIATPNKIIQPIQGRFYKLRNLNVGVGDRDDFGIEHGERSHIRWLYGEIHILDGLNNLIKVSRDGFNYSSDFEELKKYFNSRLQHHSTKLEKNVKFQKEVKQTGKQFRVSDIKLLQPESLNRQLEGFIRDGYEIRDIESYRQSKPVKIDEEKKEIFINRNVAQFEKHMFVGGKRYRVQSDKWDYKNDFFPACKLKADTITINQDYPLFNSVKYNDIFVKLHLILLLNFENGTISKKTFSSLVLDVLNYYSDYQK